MAAGGWELGENCAVDPFSGNAYSSDVWAPSCCCLEGVEQIARLEKKQQLILTFGA